MAREMWTLLLVLLLPALGHAQSGDGDSEDGDADLDAEPECFSEISLKVSNITCYFSDVIIGTKISLCSLTQDARCWNSTLKGSYFTAAIDMILAKHTLTVQEGKPIVLVVTDIVKLPPPQNITAIYDKNSGDVNISFSEYRHDYVKHFNFHVEISNETKVMNFTKQNDNLIIARDMLGDVKGGSKYWVRARVRPQTFYFNGPWSEWSPMQTFTVDKDDEPEEVLLYSIIIATIAILLLVICLITRFRRKELKAYILPNVPHPKTTLVHMQKFNKGLLLSFNPEIFSDLHINRLDEVGEDKAFTDGRGVDARSRCPSQLSQVLLWQLPPGDSSSDGSQSTLQDEDGEPEDHGHGVDASSTGLRLLGEAAPAVDSGNSSDSGDPSLMSTCAPPRDCKDEAYVTMSCLFKTQ
ncbi:interleukin-7 receptor subunit alpha [Sardina pilchardus]|uniref:interleukin-7 receptor subunit alpha n=1 Tax=Sardina pilchardus TaxID=27697 RepID=UPI002E12A46F